MRIVLSQELEIIRDVVSHVLMEDMGDSCPIKTSRIRPDVMDQTNILYVSATAPHNTSPLRSSEIFMMLLPSGVVKVLKFFNLSKSYARAVPSRLDETNTSLFGENITAVIRDVCWVKVAVHDPIGNFQSCIKEDFDPNMS